MSGKTLRGVVLGLAVGSTACGPRGLTPCTESEAEIVAMALDVDGLPPLDYKPDVYCGEVEEEEDVNDGHLATAKFIPGRHNDIIVLRTGILAELERVYTEGDLLGASLKEANYFHGCTYERDLRISGRLPVIGEYTLSDAQTFAVVFRHELDHLERGQHRRKDSKHIPELDAAYENFSDCENEGKGDCLEEAEAVEAARELDPIYVADENYREALNGGDLVSVQEFSYHHGLGESDGYNDCLNDGLRPLRYDRADGLLSLEDFDKQAAAVTTACAYAAYELCLSSDLDWPDVR